jgi:thioredoxin 1
MRKIIGLAALLGTGIIMAFSSPKEKETLVSTVIKEDLPGIKFTNLTYSEALKLSAKTGKPIFIDCYTVWCGPCKLLAKNTFTNTAVGDFFNENFINLKIEMELDADGLELSRLFKIRGYPTLLFIDGKGELVKESVGYVTSEQLLATAKEVVKK